MNHHWMQSVTDSSLLALMVGVSYVLDVIALILIILRGSKKKGWGMSSFSVAALGGVCLMCLIGPTVEPGLFPAASGWYYLIWGIWLVLLAVIFYQFLLYSGAKLEPISVLVVSLLGVWTFIVFYQDYYVNEASPFAVLAMAVGYFYLLFVRESPFPDALSVPGAWLLAIGTLMLYLATALGDMSAAYPGHEETGYAFVYYLYILTLLMLFAYAIRLTRQRMQAAGGTG